MKIAKTLAVWVPALVVALSGAMKLAGNAKILAGMTKLGVLPYVPLLGTLEVTFAALVVAPAMFRLGFLLASCYFAGAIATELSHGALTVNPFIMISAVDRRVHSRPIDLLRARSGGSASVGRNRCALSQRRPARRASECSPFSALLSPNADDASPPISARGPVSSRYLTLRLEQRER
jgi:hypothetical protein